jgi:UDP-2,3-diacylglucosamine pyrophosphatase LpxH
VLPAESLLVFSDVHLGSDLQDGAVNRARRSLSVDVDLVRLLAHYRAERPPADRWRIVIAGDFIDFIGVTLPADASLATPPTEEELEHGLGSAEDHARLKLKRVAVRHADVFGALAAFVSDGHALTIVHGNHDIEFHWDGVKDDFRAILRSLVPAAAVDQGFEARIEFNPWFFWRDGVAYIEHGHQYDPFCSTANVMSPLSPLDPRRVARGFSDTLIRFVVRQTKGMKEHGHENVGMFYYLAFGVRLGVGGVARLGVRFVRAVIELFRLRRAYVSEAAVLLRAEHEQRVSKLAEATRIGKDRLRALLKLQTPPITASIRGILASVLLDRLALAMIATLTLLGLALFGALHGHGLWAGAAVLVAWSLLHRHLASSRHVDAGATLVERAAHLSRLFPAAFVVMGHTHVPTAVPAGQATYINVGSWAEEETEPEEPAYRAPRTHLVIHVRGDRPEALFLSWDGAGPKRRDLPG